MHYHIYMKIRSILQTISAIGIITGVVLFSGCATVQTPSSNANSNSTITVATSFYILEEFTKQVGGDYVTVVTPPGSSGGHSYSPTPQDVAALLNSDIFILQGASFDPWAEKLISDFESQDIPVIKITDYLGLQELDQEYADEEDTFNDPHTWTDPIRAIQTIEIIRDELVKLDPKHTNEYTANANNYIEQLRMLDTEYAAGLEACSIDTAVVAHEAFGYMAGRYGFHIEAIAGFSPDSVPSANHLAELNTIIKDKHIGYVLFETLTTPDVAESLANDVGAKTLVLNPMEGVTADERQAGENYLSIMRKNLETLELAMNCQ